MMNDAIAPATGLQEQKKKLHGQQEDESIQEHACRTDAHIYLFLDGEQGSVSSHGQAEEFCFWEKAQGNVHLPWTEELS